MNTKEIVVIATYNEKDNIIKILNQLKRYHVIIVDDSNDGTYELIRDFANEYTNVDIIHRAEKLGIASAYWEGMEFALTYNPEYVIQMDAGLTHNPRLIKNMLSMARYYDLDLVIGSRFDKFTKSLGYRTWISKGAAYLMRAYFPNIQDATSGFRCWKAETLSWVMTNKPFFSRGFAFQLETLFRLYLCFKHAKVWESKIPYTLTNSTFNFKMIAEALWMYFMFITGIYDRLWVF